ncbi:MAG TPA: ABC transporter permease [Gemmatimonadaceae bacterium]|nr:ABC transporter permease [Gemmatimonadaceae bacterium]
MMRGLWRLTWVEIKIFLREPLGALGTVVPVAVFVVLGKVTEYMVARGGPAAAAAVARGNATRPDLPVLAAMLIALNAVLSLVSVVSIYREGGILKRLRATPLRPQTILTAQVLVKLFFTAVTVTLMMLAGRRYIPPDSQLPMVGFAVALLVGTLSILSIGFLIASLVPTARLAQPVAAFVLYPMVGVSGLVVPLSMLPSAARYLPLTFVVSLLKGISHGEPWSHHLGDVAALAVYFVLFTAISAKVFRWE